MTTRTRGAGPEAPTSARPRRDTSGLTIDGLEVIAPKGELVIRTAERLASPSRGSATTRCSTRSAPAGSAWSRWRWAAGRCPSRRPPAP